MLFYQSDCSAFHPTISVQEFTTMSAYFCEINMPSSSSLLLIMFSIQQNTYPRQLNFIILSRGFQVWHCLLLYSSSHWLFSFRPLSCPKSSQVISVLSVKRHTSSFPQHWSATIPLEMRAMCTKTYIVSAIYLFTLVRLPAVQCPQHTFGNKSPCPFFRW